MTTLDRQVECDCVFGIPHPDHVTLWMKWQELLAYRGYQSALAALGTGR